MERSIVFKQDRDEVVRLYTEEGLSVNKIHSILDISRYHISRILHEEGVNVTRAKPTFWTKERNDIFLENELTHYYTAKGLAHLLKTSVCSIRAHRCYLKSKGILPLKNPKTS